MKLIAIVSLALLTSTTAVAQNTASTKSNIVFTTVHQNAITSITWTW